MLNGVSGVFIMEQASDKKRQLLATVAVLAVTVIIVMAAVITTKKPANTTTSEDANTTDTTATPETTTSSTSTTSVQSSGSYKNGSYKATGNYTSPDGAQQITISVSLKDDTVVATSATKGANGRDSEEYQGKFISGYKSQVIGKAIDSLQLNHVSGSSLTPQGFNDALDKIKQQAEA
jgi:hypothetical protein